MKPLNRYTIYVLLFFGSCTFLSAVCRYYTPEGSFVLEGILVISTFYFVATALRAAFRFIRTAT